MDSFFCFVRWLVHFAVLCVLVIFSLSIYVYLLSVHSTYPMLCSCRPIQRPSQTNLCISCKYILCGLGQRLHKCAALSRSNLFILQLSKANLKCQRNSVKLFSVIRGPVQVDFNWLRILKGHAMLLMKLISPVICLALSLPAFHFLFSRCRVSR